MAHLLETKLRSAADQSHIWWGVSVEDRKHGLARLDLLRSTTARVRFLSVEPLLEDLGALKVKGIDWVIVGGESGPGARTMEERWVTSIQQECKTERVPFFFKQWGGFLKKKAGRLLAERTFDEMPPRPRAVVPSALAYQSIMTKATRLETEWKKRPTSLREAKQFPGAASGQGLWCLSSPLHLGRAGVKRAPVTHPRPESFAT